VARWWSIGLGGRAQCRGSGKNGSDDRRADKWIRSAGEAQAVSGGDLGGEVRRGCEFQGSGGECAKGCDG